MKIKTLNWINLFVFVLDIFAAIFGFINGHIVVAILCIVAGLFNLYVFLSAVSLWWETSRSIRDTYVFECPYCNFRFNPTFWQWFFVPHIGKKRYLKCKTCGAYSFMKRDHI